MKEKYMKPEELTPFLTLLFEKAGMGRADAEFSAECMVKTNLWGVDSHGVLRLPIYLKRVMEKVINPTPCIVPVSELDGPMALLDGDAGMGYVVGKAGMVLAIEKAKKFGLGMVLVRNSNHYGAAALYARMAAEEGMIGISTTNVIPNIGMKGNVKPSTGNNPIALAAPLEGDFPFVLDISLSEVAGGKLLLAAKKGDKIPTNWAVTKEGKETDDPKEGFAGFLLPIGMHKGFGLSLFIDLITGVLSGGPFLHGLKSMYKHADEPSLTSHLFIVINPSVYISKEDYKERIIEWAGMVHGTPMVEPQAKQVIPGELEYKKELERREQGIPFPVELIHDINTYCEKLRIDLPEALK